MKNCIIISVNFPPIGGIGVQRIVKLAKYLIPLGYNITVLTVPENSTRLIHDITMKNDVNSKIKVLRPFFYDYKKIIPGDISKIFKPLERKYLFPDRFRIWNIFCLKTLRKLFKEKQYDFVFVNCPPFSGVELAYKIKKEFNTKVLLNLRDPFSFNNYNILKNNDKKRLRSYKIEKKAFKIIDSVITVTPDHLKKYTSLFPEYSSKFSILTNGFDTDDFPLYDKSKPEDNFFKIGYSGSFSSLVPLEPLLDSIYRLNKEKGTNIMFSISTNKPLKKIISLHKKCYDAGYIKFLGFLPHKESIKNLYTSNLLALIFANDPATEGSYPGKVFEYFKVGKPILLLNNKTSDIAQLIKRTKTGQCLDINNKEEIMLKLLDIYEKWKSTKTVDYTPDQTEINKFDYSNIAVQFDLIVNKILE